MGFHFTTLKADYGQYHAIIEADDDGELGEIVSALPDHCSLKSRYRMTPSVDGFLTEFHAVETVRIRKKQFREAMLTLVGEGRKIADEYVKTIPPFRSVEGLIVEDGARSCVESRDVKNACPTQTIEMDGVLFMDHAVQAVAKGVRSRIYETHDFSFYFAAAATEEDEVVNFLVRANEQCDIDHAIRQYPARLRRLFYHRLSPATQAFCGQMYHIQGTPHDVSLNPLCDPDPEEEMTFPSESYKKFLRALRNEGLRIYEAFKETYPSPPEKIGPTTADAIDALPPEWRDTAKALDAKRPVTLKFHGLRQIVLDMLGSGYIAD